MKKPVYTSIPDTRDTNYWMVKERIKADRCVIYVPRDRELHRSLLQKAYNQKQVIRKRDLTSYNMPPAGGMPKTAA